MAFDPGFTNADEDAHLVEQKARIKPDYSILSTDSKPTLSSADAGRVLEETDTADRYRWTGTQWIKTNSAGAEIVSDGGISLTVDSDDGSLSVYHKPDYSQLSTDGDPAPAATDYGVTLEYTDTGDRFRWTGTQWVQTHTSEAAIVAANIALFDGYGNPIGSLGGAIDIHDADVHDVPVNKLFHRHTGTSTTLAAAITGGGTSPSTITVVSGVGFTNGDPIQIESATIIEPTFPTIISGGGTTTLVLDRPIDNNFAIGDSVEQVETNLAVDGSITPVAFMVLADIDQVWHIVRFLLAMTHSTAADDGKFGDIAALTNGCVLRGYNGAAGRYRTFTLWKSNFDIKMDMFDVTYTDKAGAGDFGTNARGSIKDGTGAVPKISDPGGDFLELLIQDDLTGLIKLNLKAQGHIEGL